MAKSPAVKVVETYLDALYVKKDADAAGASLASDLHFKGPIDTFHRASDLTQSLKALAPITEGIKIRKLWADGDDVVAIYDFVTRTPAGTVLLAEWFHVVDGKIKAINLLFDPRPFLALRGP